MAATLCTDWWTSSPSNWPATTATVVATAGGRQAGAGSRDGVVDLGGGQVLVVVAPHPLEPRRAG
jgi:hypothetical protein